MVMAVKGAAYRNRQLRPPFFTTANSGPAAKATSTSPAPAGTVMRIDAPAPETFTSPAGACPLRYGRSTVTVKAFSMGVLLAASTCH